MAVATFLESVVALGVLAAVAPAGLMLVQRTDFRRAGGSPLYLWAVSIPLGIAIWSIPMVVTAQIGAFSPVMLGAVGWALVLTAAYRQRIRNGNRRLARLSTLALLLSIALLAWLYGGFSNETLIGDRDEGLYSLTALLLERTGGLGIDVPAAAAIAPALHPPFRHGQQVGQFALPGVYETSKGWLVQFPSLLPTWIAQIASATSGGGLFRSSALFSLAAVIVFYALARPWLRPPVALLATMVFALNPAQIWISRVNLVEPLARLLVLGGLLAAVIALDRRSTRLAGLAAVCFGVATFGRFDLFVLSPLLLAALLVMRVWRSARYDAAAGTMAWMAMATFVAQLVAASALVAWSPIYLQANAGPVIAASISIVAGSLVLLLVRGQRLEALRTPSVRQVLAFAMAVAMLLLFAYAALLREGIEPHARIVLPGHSIDGARDYRERSLVALAAYVGWPTLVLAVVGAAIAVVRVLRKPSHPALPMLLMVFVPVSLGILANPSVSPDHFWAVRRYVPLVIPGMILFAAYGLQACLARIVGPRQRGFAGALTVAAGALLLAAQWPTLFVRENEGIATQLAAFDRKLAGSRLVLVRGFDALATTLALGFGRSVLPLRDDAVAIDPAAMRFWSHCAPDAPCTLVHWNHRGLAGLAVGPAEPLTIERRLIEKTPIPLPRGEMNQVHSFLVSPVTGLNGEQTSALLGGFRDWRIQERGFYLEDLTASGSERWTDGDATIRLPHFEADTLEIRFVVPGDRPRPVSITLDGTVLHEGPLAGAQRLRFALPRSNVGEPRELRIRSAVFNPKSEGLNADGRDLGVRLQGVRQVVASTPRLGSASDNVAFRSRVTPVGGWVPGALTVSPSNPQRPVSVMVANEGNAVWPGGHEAGDGEVPVILGVAWKRRSDGVVVHEQRVELPFALHPGERLLMTPTLDGRVDGGTRLPAGDYEVIIDLLQEHIGWFASRGGTPARFDVSVAAVASAEH